MYSFIFSKDSSIINSEALESARNYPNMGSATYWLLGFRKVNFSKSQFSELYNTSGENTSFIWLMAGLNEMMHV